MGIETGDTIADLNPLWPLGTDPKAEGDNHLRLIKDVMQKDALSLADGGTVEGIVSFEGLVQFNANVVGPMTVGGSLTVTVDFTCEGLAALAEATADSLVVSGPTTTQTLAVNSNVAATTEDIALSDNAGIGAGQALRLLSGRTDAAQPVEVWRYDGTGQEGTGNAEFIAQFNTPAEGAASDKTVMTRDMADARFTAAGTALPLTGGNLTGNLNFQKDGPISIRFYTSALANTTMLSGNNGVFSFGSVAMDTQTMQGDWTITGEWTVGGNGTWDIFGNVGISGILAPDKIWLGANVAATEEDLKLDTTGLIGAGADLNLASGRDNGTGLVVIRQYVGGGFEGTNNSTEMARFNTAAEGLPLNTSVVTRQKGDARYTQSVLLVKALSLLADKAGLTQTQKQDVLQELEA